jgi:DNA-binding Xre family transcriptional regulator
MIELRIKEVAQKRGLTTAYQLQKMLGCPPSAAARLWRSDQKMVSLDTIDILCQVLECEPADLIVRVADRKKIRSKQ